MQRIFFLVFAFYNFILLAEPIKVFEPTYISSLDLVTVLNTSPNSKWYLSMEPVDPLNFTQNYLKKKEIIGNWMDYTVPSKFSKQNFNRLEIKKVWIAKSLYFPKDWEANSIGIRLGIINDRDITYFNGIKIAATGEMRSSKPQSYDKVRIYEIPATLIQKDAENFLLVEIEEYFEDEMGITQDRVEIGPIRIIEKNFYKDEYIKIILLMMYLTVGLYFSFLFIRRRKEKENLFFGLFAILLVIYQFLRNQLKYELGVEFELLKKIEYLIVFTLVTIFFHFLRTFFHYKWNIFYKIVDGIIAIIFLFALFYTDIELYNTINENIVQPIWIIYLITGVYYLINKIREQNKDAIYILIGTIIMIIGTTIDSLSTRGIIIFPRVMGYIFIFFIMSLAIILANRFVKLNEEIEELNEGLEKKVIQRTRELSQSLEEIKKLKIAQDGDYFLTSLLIRPLGKNKTSPNELKLDFVVRQKKEFEFRGKKYDLGGDLCRAEEIYLQNKKMTVFFNADAMGKSMQGAGGALVMGSVFDAILERTKLNLDLQNLYPEKWLKLAFIELHKVFESFQGSMLVSIVLGIVENETGLLYFINAEHPFPVIYRDGKASFLAEENIFQKLGSTLVENFIFVNTFQLQLDDIIIIGSDGRDDLIPHGQSEIQFNPSMFLNLVEKAKGNIFQIVELLPSLGIITDDLSLLSIKYNKKIENINYKDFHRDVIELLREKKFLEAENTLSTHHQKYPADTMSIYLLSFVYRKLQNYPLSIYYGERVRLREPNNTKNLLNLARSYFLSQNVSRADYILNIVKKLYNEISS